MVAITLVAHGRAVIVKGDTKEVKDFLKEKGGSWNKGLTGWCFPGSKKGMLLEALRANSAVTSVTDSTAGGAAPAAAASPAASSPPAAAANAGEKKRPAEKARDDPPKKAKTTSGSDETVLDLGDYVRAAVNKFQGSIGVDIRKHYLEKDSGEIKPTAKGVRLKPEEWQALRGAAGSIAAAGHEDYIKVKEDGELQVKVNTEKGRCYDLRRYYLDTANERKPTKKGIYLKVDAFDALMTGEAGKSIDALLRGEPIDETLIKTASVQRPASSGDHLDFSSEDLKKKMEKLLEGRDLSSLSLKGLRTELEAAMSLPEGGLEARKDELKMLVTNHVQG